MKVVLLTTAPLSLRFLRGHIRLLQENGADVFVIASPSPILDAFAVDHGVEVSGIEMQRRIAPFRDLVALCRLIYRLRRIRPDIVHAHTPKAGLLGMLAALIAMAPIRLYHIHGLPLMTAGGIKRWLLWMCDAIACRLAHQVFCVSQSIMHAVKSEGICRAEKLAILANGTIDGIDSAEQYNPNRFPPSTRLALRRSLNIAEGARVVGFVGRIVKDKGIYELLEAFSQLSNEFDDLHLLIVGLFEGHQPITLEAKATIEGDSRIHLVGFTEDPAPYYTLMDVLAFPTYREGFGLVAAEASALEVPVVATSIPGCVDAVCDGVTGTLVPPKDARALATAIAYYLRNPELSRQHGNAGRKRVLQDFQPEQVREALWRRYSSWMNASQRRSTARIEPMLPRRVDGHDDPSPR